MESGDGSCQHNLSNEDYGRLPQTARAYEGCAENELVRVTPSILKVPCDDPSLHMAKLILWNKTKKRVDFRLGMASHSHHFTLYYEKTAIYGSGQETILVKVKPYDQRLICTTLKIQVSSSDSETVKEINIPIELFPDCSWFQLPRIIIMPMVAVGKCFDAIITLPKAPAEEDEGLFFFISHGNTQAISVSPADGTICREGNVGTESLTITHHPREYTTISHTILIHFPSLMKKPYDITLYLRSNPTTYGRQEICTFPLIRKLASKATKLKLMEPNPEEDWMPKETEDLTTPAAVVKFLLKPPGKAASSTDLTGPTGFTHYEEHKAYKMEEKKFYEKVSQLQTLQQNLHLQPSRAFLGEIALEEDSEIAKEIISERDKHRFIYDKWLGLEISGIEDLTRGKTKMARRRGLRDLDEPYIPNAAKAGSISSDALRGHILRPFIQAVLTVITRQRATKRIVKLRLLVKQKRTEILISRS